MTDAELLNLYDDATFGLLDGHLTGLRAVERAARAAEREACAEVCEREAERWEGDDGQISTEARLCAIAIRNRAKGQR